MQTQSGYLCCRGHAFAEFAVGVVFAEIDIYTAGADYPYYPCSLRCLFCSRQSPFGHCGALCADWFIDISDSYFNNSDMPQTTTIQTADGPVEAQLEPYATKMLRI